MDCLLAHLLRVHVREGELETEKEVEREVERQIPKQQTAVPKSWNFSDILSVTSPAHLPEGAGVTPIHSAVSKYLHPSLKEIRWDICKIFVTSNFIRSVHRSLGEKKEKFCIDEYLRPVDAVVLFPSRECLLLSEWEADIVLQLLWSEPSVAAICSLSYLMEASSRGSRVPPPLIVPKQTPESFSDLRPSDHTIAGLHLFSVGTMFGEWKGAFKDLVPTHESKKAALLLPRFRGCGELVPRSDLEMICCVTD